MNEAFTANFGYAHDELLGRDVGLDVQQLLVVTRQHEPGLQLQQRRDEHEELGRHLEVQLAARLERELLTTALAEVPDRRSVTVRCSPRDAAAIRERLLEHEIVVEAMSVIIQVGWFKFTKKRYGTGRRVFLMAPLHHHFEQKGWKETQVVVRFWIITMLLCLVGLSTLKLR